MGGKNRLQIRAALRTDLKDSGTLWSNDELDRAVERAVSDLSRMLPLEKVYEKSLQFTISSESFTSPKDTDVDYIVDAQTLNGKAAGGTFTLTGSQPDHPRVVTVLITDADASLTNFTIIVKGADAKGKYVEETFHFGGGLSQTGKKEFKYIREVELDQVAGTAVAGDVLDVGIGAYTNVWAELANKPIKYGSETISSQARNTAYYMDYANGRIKAISGGLAANTAYSISYTIGRIWLDLNNIPDLIRVESVAYPVGDIPQSLAQWDIFGNILTVTGLGEAEEQQSMAEDKHIAVYYAAEHQVPSDFNPGSYPEFLENTVILAAEAYALFQYALKLGHAALTDLTTAGTRLGSVSHTLFATALTAAAAQAVLLSQALDKVSTYLAGDSGSTKASLTSSSGAAVTTAAVTALDAAHTALGTVDFVSTLAHIEAAATALNKIATYLESNTSEDSKYWLTKITTDIAGLRTAILASLEAAGTYLGLVATDISSADSVRKNYMGAVANYVDGGTAPDVKKYLDDGDAVLNSIATGGENERTPEMYMQFARAVRDALVAPHEQDRNFRLENATRRVNAAIAYMEEATQRLSNLRSYIDQADAWGRIAAGFVNEAVQRLQAAFVSLSTERARVEQAAGYDAEAAQRVDLLRAYIEQSLAYARIAEGFVGEARERASGARVYIDEANARLQEMNIYLGEADRYTAIAMQDMALADRFRTEAIERRNEAWSIWRDRKQYIGDFTQSSVRQMPTGNQ